MPDSFSDEDEKDLISELKVMQYVGVHPNIVGLLGAAVHEGMSESRFDRTVNGYVKWCMPVCFGI